MIQQGKDLKDMDLISLKAMAYDLIAQGEQNQMNLRMVNQMIEKKLQEPKVEVGE